MVAPLASLTTPVICPVVGVCPQAPPEANKESAPRMISDIVHRSCRIPFSFFSYTAARFTGLTALVPPYREERVDRWPLRHSSPGVAWPQKAPRLRNR